jgi:hypothetical protein
MRARNATARNNTPVDHGSARGLKLPMNERPLPAILRSDGALIALRQEPLYFPARSGCALAVYCPIFHLRRRNEHSR